MLQRSLVIGMLFLCGCPRATDAQLRQRASFDLSCPETQLNITRIDRRTRGVDGCGQRVVYVERCLTSGNQYSTGPADCTWVLNTQTSGGQAPPPPGQPGTAPPPPTAQPTPAPPSVEADIQRGLQERRQVILDCTGGQAADVVAAYSADGSVSFSLAGPLAGTPAESCVRQALGTPQLNTGGQSGVVRHSVPAGPTSAPPPPAEATDDAPWEPPPE